MREMIVFALVALFSEAVVPGVMQYASGRSAVRPEAAEEAETEEAAEPEGEAEEEQDDGSVARLEEDNRLLKELVGEKELALRRLQDGP